MGIRLFSRRELKKAAKLSLKHHWGAAIAAAVLVGLLAVILTAPSGVITCGMELAQRMGTVYLPGRALRILSIAGALLEALLLPALAVGLYRFYLRLSRNRGAKIGKVFSAFSCMGKALGLTLMIALKVFLWSLLFFLPGVIAAYRYSQAFYLLADHPDMGVMQCIRESGRMMKGHKWSLFVLELSFFWWDLLVAVTGGIAGLWVTPYVEVTKSNFYRMLAGEALLQPEPTAE